MGYKIISDSSYYEKLQSDAQKGSRTKYNRLQNWNVKAKSLDQKLVRTMKSKNDTVELQWLEHLWDREN